MKKSLLACLALALLAPPAAAELKIGHLPIVDALPFFVAQQKGFFDQAGVKVTLVPFNSALERDAALTGDALDLAIHDIPAIGMLAARGGGYPILTLVTRPDPEHRLFALLASPKGGPATTADLAGVPVGVSTNSIIEYVVRTALTRAGVPAARQEMSEVRQMPVRMQMLLEGSLKAAAVPEPLATMAVANGARVLADDRDMVGTGVVLVVAPKTLAAKKDELSRLKTAYQMALQAIAENPDAFRSLLVEKARLPEPIKQVYRIQPFAGVVLPEAKDIDEVLAWLKGRGLIEIVPSAGSLVTDAWTR